MIRKVLLVVLAVLALSALGTIPAFAQHPTPTPEPVHPTPTPEPVHPTATPVAFESPTPTSTTPPPAAPANEQPQAPQPTPTPIPPTIADIVVNSANGNPPEFVTLLNAVLAADPSILAALSDRSAQLTVFAPTDAAFQTTLNRLGLTAEELLADRDQLTRILQYHVVPGIYNSSALTTIAGQTNNRLGTLTNATVQFTLNNGLRVNNIPVLAADITAVNGIIHVIGEVLIPPVYVQPTIAQIVVNSTQATPPQFVTLLAAVQAADPSILAALADENGSLTVFAPTDAAFTALLNNLGLSAQQLLANRDLLTEVLRYHVLAGEFDSTTLVGFARQGIVQNTLLGEQVTFNLDNNGNLRVNASNVVAADIRASNGIIHIIDAVLVPPVRRTIAEIVVDAANSNPAEFTILLAAVQAADPSILQALADENARLTVFAPTDAAFAALLSDLGLTAEELLADTDLLTTVLLYHVLPNQYDEGALRRLAAEDPRIATLLGQTVAFSTNGSALRVNDSNIIAANIDASNGFVHVIDKVLLPELEESKTIAEIVVDSTQADPPQFVTLLAAVQAADPSILAALADENGSLTVFAPTDAAFTALLNNLGLSAQQLLADRDLLTEVLRYHVLAGEFDSTTLVGFARQGVVQNTLLGEQLTFNLDNNGNLRVNASNVVAADIRASNGIIHVIDAVLVPPARRTIAEIVVETASANPAEFTILLAAVQAADPAVLAALSDENARLTVFAPTDAAFVALLNQLGLTAEELLADTDLLTTVLLYHVLPEQYDAGALRRLAAEDPRIATLLGQTVTFSASGSGLRVNNSNIIATNIDASNGFVHVIDAVLVPSL